MWVEFWENILNNKCLQNKHFKSVQKPVSSAKDKRKLKIFWKNITFKVWEISRENGKALNLQH